MLLCLLASFEAFSAAFNSNTLYAWNGDYWNKVSNAAEVAFDMSPDVTDCWLHYAIASAGNTAPTGEPGSYATGSVAGAASVWHVHIVVGEA